MKRVFWIGLLAASLTGNAYLWCSRPAPPPTLPDPPRRAPYTMPELKFPTRDVPIPASYASADRGDLEQRLADTEARIEELLPIDVRFGRAVRSPEIETLVRPYFDAVFKPLEDPVHNLECRGRICKIAPKPTNRGEWMLRMQRMVGRVMFSSMAFIHHDAYVELASEINGAAFFDNLLRATSQRIMECGARSAMGVLVIRLSIARPTVRVTVDGPLAAQPFGACVREALEDAIAEGYVSPELTLTDEPHPLTFPVD